MSGQVGFALRFAEQPHERAKTQGVHPSFPTFIRLAYAWLVVAGLMGVWAAFSDVHGGIWKELVQKIPRLIIPAGSKSRCALNHTVTSRIVT
jgi:hypothetical protein